MGKIRKFPLSIHPETTVYGLGILTDEPDYRLCWLLNQNYSWNLVRSDDLLISDKEHLTPQSYACFVSDTDQKPWIKLISNRSKTGIWLTVFKQVDFLIVVPVEKTAGDYLNEIKTTLIKKIPEIRGLFKVPLPSFCYL